MTTAPPQGQYEFGFLDSDAKREIRRSVLKAIAIPGYQVPYSSREMPLARGFGTGGLQVTLSLIGVDDTLKVIDQGSDDSVNSVNTREFVRRVCPGVRTTTRTAEATVIQSRHRIPERPLTSQQLLVLQVPYPDPLVLIEPNDQRRRQMHAEGDYARLYVKLFEDLLHYGEITISHRYPTRINSHYIVDPSPIPRHDTLKLNQRPSLILFAAGREKRIYAIPPYTDAVPLSFEDAPFRVERFVTAEGVKAVCSLCGSSSNYLEESESGGTTRYQCSDTDGCKEVRLGLAT